MPDKYEIKIIGILDAHWSEWFDSETIPNQANGVSILTCEVSDQASLFSLLRKVRDAGLTLQSVRQIDTQQDDLSSDNA